MALKQDAVFRRLVTIGAAGTAAVLDALDKEHGHRAVELERYATSNKIWQTKLKRIRVPDLVCLDCGVRVEVRGKSELAIRMSHSSAKDRAWDAGLRDDDFAAFVVWRADSATIADNQHFFQIGAMRSAIQYTTQSTRKAASEGSEQDIKWPARVPARDGIVTAIDRDAGTVRFQPLHGRGHTYSMPQGVPAHVYVARGEALRAGEDFLLGCLPRPNRVKCAGKTWNFVADLDAEDGVDRYVAVKAAGIDGSSNAVQRRLLEIVQNQDEDERTRLEARGSLARIDPGKHTTPLIDRARQATGGSRKAREFAMECVLILTELGGQEAKHGLEAIATDTEIDSETRCAAVWGLGVAGIDSPSSVIPFLGDGDDNVALHALAGIGELNEAGIRALGRTLESGNDKRAASAAELLTHEGEVGIGLLLEIAHREDRAGVWARAALGATPEKEVRELVGGQLTPGLIAILAPMWVGQESWLVKQRADSPLDLLRQQRIRHLG